MALNPIKFITSNSATATNGSDVVTVSGNTDCRYVYSGTAVFLGSRQVVEAISGTAPDANGNSFINLRYAWPFPDTTDRLVAINTIEGMSESIRYAREVVSNTEVISAEADRAAANADKSGELAKKAGLYADLARTLADLYTNVESGLAAVAEGEFFQVPSSVANEFTILYQKIGGIAEERNRYPGVKKVDELEALLSGGFESKAYYKGTSDEIPIITDRNLANLLSISRSTGKIKAHGLLSEDEFSTLNLQAQNSYLNSKNQAGYIGNGPIVPFITDSSLKILLGVDISTGKLVGQFDIFPDIPLEMTKENLDIPLLQPIPYSSFRHLLFYGQSLSVGANAGSVISVSQPYSNLTFRGGPRAWTGTAWDFGALIPLVEDDVSPAPDGGTNRKETVCSGAANYASMLMAVDGLAPSENVILASTAGKGGSRISQLSKGTAWYLNLLQHVVGGNNLNPNYSINALCYIQGESDADSLTSYSDYRTALYQLQADAEIDFQSITGTTEPLYLLTYQCSYKAKTHADIALAQLDSAKKNDKIHMVTPTYHLPYSSDNTHLIAVGYKILGAYFGRAYKQLLSGICPKYLAPISATIIGNLVRVRFAPPKLPLVLDTTNLAPTTNFGFKVTAGSSTATISSVGVDGPDVLIHLTTVPVGQIVVRYALDSLGTGLGISGGASGNLRDSTQDQVIIGSQTINLWHVSPAFQLTAVKLEI